MTARSTGRGDRSHGRAASRREAPGVLSRWWWRWLVPFAAAAVFPALAVLMRSSQLFGPVGPAVLLVGVVATAVMLVRRGWEPTRSQWVWLAVLGVAILASAVSSFFGLPTAMLATTGLAVEHHRARRPDADPWPLVARLGVIYCVYPLAGMVVLVTASINNNMGLGILFGLMVVGVPLAVGGAHLLVGLIGAVIHRQVHR